MKPIIYLFTLLLSAISLNAQGLRPVMDTIMSEDANSGVLRAELKWGYQSKVGEWAVYPIYDYAGEFSEGLAPVGLREGSQWKYGFINEQGELAIQLMYDDIGHFSEGLAYAAILNIPWEDKPAENEYNKIGYINASNEMVIELPDKYSKPSKKCYYVGELFTGGLAKMRVTNPAQCPSYGPIAVDTEGNVMVVKQED